MREEGWIEKIRKSPTGTTKCLSRLHFWGKGNEKENSGLTKVTHGGSLGEEKKNCPECHS